MVTDKFISVCQGTPIIFSNIFDKYHDSQVQISLGGGLRTGGKSPMRPNRKAIYTLYKLRNGCRSLDIIISMSMQFMIFSPKFSTLSKVPEAPSKCHSYLSSMEEDHHF